ncbi:MAG TPA: hypothetical protein VG435_08650 [Acidimicrobiales bacterium]|jgi:hypothetical protein|nr:hypothetical protein [Acidimicrobiales bacterium]
MKVSSVTFVSADDGWVLGQVGGRVRVERTTDGGSRWTPLETSPPFGPGPSGAPTGIRFADLVHGYVFGRDALDVTSNGGQSWQQVAIADEDGASDGTGAADVEAAGGRVWLLNAAAPYPSIYTATVGSTSFGRVGRAGNRGAFVEVHRSEAYVVGFEGAGPVPPNLEVATTAGVSNRQSPCGGIGADQGTSSASGQSAGDFVGLAPAITPGVLYAVCGGDTTSTTSASFLYRSDSDGRSWTGVTVLHACVAAALAVTDSTAFVACRNGGVRAAPLTSTTSHSVLGSMPVQYVGFTNDQDGVAISGVAQSQAGAGDLYLTRNSGEHWTKAAT